MRTSSVLMALVCAPCMTVCVQAQVPTGSITGFVTDPEGAAVSGAGVTITSATQGFVRHSAKNTDGIYVLFSLPTGRYHLRVDKPGFAPSHFAQTIIEAGRATTEHGWTNLRLAETVHLTALFAAFNRVVNGFGSPSQGLLERTSLAGAAHDCAILKEP